MLNKSFYHYLIKQYLIILIPPMVMALLFNINHYMTNFIEEFVSYTLGLSGLILMFIARTVVTKGVMVYILFLLIKIFTLYPFFVAMYLKFSKVKWLPFLVSSLISLWGIFFGLLWMVAALQ